MESLSQPSAAPAPGASGQAALRRIYNLRWYFIGGQALAVIAAYFLLEATLPLNAIAMIGGALVVMNLLTAFRLRSGGTVSNWELAGQLAGDMTQLGLLIYFTGGASNPLISLLLVPLAMAEVTLEPRQVIPLAVYSVLVYSVLALYSQTLHVAHGTMPYSAHLLGMWGTYVLAATLTASYVTRIAGELRNRDRELAKIRERELRNQQIIALGTLAAGAAHELGTPLSTIAVLAPELERSCAREPKEKEDFALLRTQVSLCRGILTDLLAHTGQVRGEGGKRMSVEELMDEVIAKWKLLRPAVRMEVVKDLSRACEILADDTLRQALLNLLNNAADVSPGYVGVRAHCDGSTLTVTIEDDGPGMDEEAARRVGEAFYSKRADGMGLGVFLARATITRLGGQVNFVNRPERGLRTTVTLPMDRLRVDQCEAA
jgi:two-component system sensor histidine kinase RegB